MEKEGSEKGRKSATDTLPIYLEDNEAIPAATYQPSPERGDSDSSTDFEGEVNKVMDGKHSQSINRVWMSQHEQPCVKTQGVFIPELDKKCACCYPWKAKLRGRHGFH